MEKCDKCTTFDIDYCCKSMKFSVEDCRIQLKYDPIIRKYEILSTNYSDSMPIKYCPFCRKKLPKSLYKKWCSILKKEYNIKDYIYNKVETADIPQEFKTDEWWKKRGL
jgi:hypothetical protein